jgi:outer membrane lipoprotein-sorting protein
MPVTSSELFMLEIHRRPWLAGVALVLGAAAPAAAAPLDPKAVHDVLVVIDERQRSPGDYKALAYMESKEKDKTDVTYELVVYRRDADEKFMILFTKPRSEQGKGYLKIDKNLWMYDPTVGKWERRTERERIGGSDSRRGDFDDPRFATEYDATYTGEGKLGAFAVHQIELKAKDGVDVAYPVTRIWVDEATGNVLKRQDLALSGKLMRTAYYPRWKKLFSESKKGEVWFPEEMRFYDEIEKANSTLVLIKEIDLRPLEANLFTKAWLEARSR